MGVTNHLRFVSVRGSALPPPHLHGSNHSSRLSKVDMFASCLGIGSVFDFEVGQPLKALIFMDNFEEVSEVKEVSLEFEFKLILFWLSIYYYSKEELDYYYLN